MVVPLQLIELFRHNMLLSVYYRYEYSGRMKWGRDSLTGTVGTIIKRTTQLWKLLFLSVYNSGYTKITCF